MKTKSFSKPLSALLIIVALSVVFMPVNGDDRFPHLAGGWDTTTLTYRIATPDTCINEPPSPVPNLLQRLSAIRDAFQNWHNWLPIVNFVQVQSGGRIIISCYRTWSSPEGYGGAYVRHWDGAYFTYVTIDLWEMVFSLRYDAQGGRNIVAHEIGHALGLPDSFTESGVGGTCTLMDYCFISQTVVILQPTQDQLRELNAMFSVMATTTTTTTTTTTQQTSQTTHTSTSSTYGVSVEVSPSVWPQSILTFGQPPTPTTIALSAVGWFGIIATLILIMMIPMLRRRRM